MSFRAPAIIEHPDRYDAAVNARIKANASKGRRTRWMAADPTREGLVEWLTVTGYDKGGFLQKMLDAYNEWGSLTEGQEAAVRRTVTVRRPRRPSGPLRTPRASALERSARGSSSPG